MSQATLFDADPYAVVPTPSEKLSPDRRRTLRHAAKLARGEHPIAYLRLHPDAAPHEDRTAEGLRCKDCVFRVVFAHRSRSYPKCTYPVDPTFGPLTPFDLGRMVNASHSAATDCRGWYPACVAFKPKGGRS